MTRPASLSSLISWYRSEVDAAIPQRIHSKDIDDGGAPQWHGAFRTWLIAHPTQEDKDGHLISPLRYWTWRLRDRGTYLHALAMVDFDWVMAGNLKGILNVDAAEDYTRECLRRLHRLMYAEDGAPHEPVRPVRRDCAEKGCVNQTLRLRCREHEF